MLHSMTGFATKTFILTPDTDAKTNVTISIKSLNSRFFEASCKLPYALSHLENLLNKKFKKALSRGHVYCVIYMSNTSIFSSNVEPAINTLDGYMHAITAIKNKYDLQEDISLSHVLRLPNIFNIEEAAIDKNSLQKITDAVDDLIKKVVSERVQEGTALKTDLENRMSVMQSEITTIEAASKVLIDAQKERVNKAAQEIVDDESALAEARKNALYALLDKMDIHEEIVRFTSHLKNLQKLLGSEQLEKGKRIDFTLQELAREINTIAAKCSDATIGTHAINIKVEIEKAREQVQNVV